MKKNFRFSISDFRSPPATPASPQASRAVPAPSSSSSSPIENRKSKIENSSPPAFSLVELLVTISIIVILVGLTVVVGSKMRDSARTSHTRLTLHQAKAVADEYYVETNNDTVVSINGSSSIGTPWDWTVARTYNVVGTSGTAAIKGTDTIGSDADVKKYSGERFAWAAWQLDGCQKMLIGLGGSVLVDKATTSDPTDPANNFYELRDDWGNKIIYVPYSPWPPSPGASTPWPSSFLPDHPTPFFVSPGPDGDFGDVRSTATPAQNAAAKDNLYSYDSE